MTADGGKIRKSKAGGGGLILLPISAAGHLTSMVEMSKLLLRRNPALSLTLLLLPPIPGIPPIPFSSLEAMASSSGLDMRFEHLPLVEPSTASNEARGLGAAISLFILRHKPHIKAAIARCLSATPAATLVIDFFATSAIDVANELGVPTFLYFTSNASFLTLMLHQPTIKRIDDVAEMPGISSRAPAASLPSFLVDGTSRDNECMVGHGRRFLETKGMIVNTVAELEKPVIEAIGDGRCVPEGRRAPPVYSVGPVFGVQKEIGGHECLEWLDAQPRGSVVLLCFGSMGSFDARQVKEISAGLDRSGLRFLWALRMKRPEPEKCWLPSDSNLEDVLPEGFSERTKGRGMVWPSSVPQMEILSHGAVGGFITHCGWNSCLESMWNGVPMLAWPLYAEQHYNAFLLAREWQVAVELRVDRRDGGFVSGEELERGLRVLMGGGEEGRRVRERVEEMKVVCRQAVVKGGSSFRCLEKLAATFALE